MGKKKYPDELRERATCMALEARHDPGTQGSVKVADNSCDQV